MIGIKSVTQAEQKIQKLLGLNEANWKAVAKIAIEVQKQELFKDKYKSFTAWVNAIAEKCDRQPSLIWRYIKAGKYYLESINSEDIDEIERAEAAPEVLVNLEKVQRHAPEEVFTGLKDKVLAGEVTVSESREIEQQYRPERKIVEVQQKPAEVSNVLLEDKLEDKLGDKDKLEVKLDKSPSTKLNLPTSPADIIANVLTTTVADWSKKCAGMRYLPKFSKAHTEVRVSHDRKRLRLDLVAVVRWSYKKPKDVFGVEIKSSLHDFESDRKWENYLHFCDYFCFAIFGGKSELRKAIEDNTDTKVGILEIDFSSRITYNTGHYTVNVYRKPKRLKPDSVSSIYETLYERIVGWSGSDDLDNINVN